MIVARPVGGEKLTNGWQDLIVGNLGTRGGDLDIQRAPNRGPDGTIDPNLPPYIWESSLGHSLMNSLSLRVRKRQTHGFAAGGTYTYSKSIDDTAFRGGQGNAPTAAARISARSTRPPRSSR